MAFFDVPELSGGVYDTILLLYNTSFGEYDFAMFDVYEDYPEKKYIGHVFLIIFIFVNLILLLNMVVAMMTDTYALMSMMKKGVYNY